MAHVPPPGPGPATRKVHDVARHPRLARELRTIRAMARIYCRKHHGTRASDGLCVECEALLHYATRRLDRCVFGDDKPTCANCTVHCYSESMRERCPRRHALCRSAHGLAASCARHRASARRASSGPRSADAEPEQVRGDGRRAARPGDRDRSSTPLRRGPSGGRPPIFGVVLIFVNALPVNAAAQAENSYWDRGALPDRVCASCCTSRM